MRKILVLCTLILIAGGFYVWRAMQLPTHFGEFSGAREVSLDDLVNRPTDFLGKTVAVRGAVKEQCRTMGCFFYLQAKNGKLRVELKDIAMDAPMHEGRPAHVEGQI